MEYTPVIVATMDIPQWHTLEESDLSVKNWPKDAVAKGMFTEKSQVRDKVAIVKIFKDEPLNANRVVDRKGGSVFSLGFPENKRAFTVRVNDVSGVGGFLLPDDHVDILGSKTAGLNRGGPGDNPRPGHQSPGCGPGE